MYAEPDAALTCHLLFHFTSFFNILLSFYYPLTFAQVQSEFIKQAEFKGANLAVQATLITELAILFILITFTVSVSGAVNLFVSILSDTVGILNCFSFVILTFAFSFFLGKKAGVAIIFKKRHYLLTSYAAGIAIVVLSTLISSTFSIIIQAITGPMQENWLLLFVAKPVVWMIILSVIPIVIAGSWYGLRIVKIKYAAGSSYIVQKVSSTTDSESHDMGYLLQKHHREYLL
ncbi:MAG TPA: hypothetical protein VD884_13025 [Ohtaekwangia sp.]|nr:hypothetical protein [Ohtaekwangia sp.]